MSDIENIGFEEAMERLDTVSAKLSEGNIPLDEAISLYEQGVEYYVKCKNMLEDANRRIQTIENSISGEQTDG